jgi:hypothetical protein
MAGWVAAGGAVLGAITGDRSSSRATDAQSDSEARALEFQRQASEQARNAAIPLFQSARDNSRQGFQGALDVLGQSIPQQLSMLQEGNVNAQNTLGQGLQQQQNAILGNPISNEAFQPQSLSPFDMSMFQQQLPELDSLESILSPQVDTTVVGPFPPNGSGGSIGSGAFGSGAFGNDSVALQNLIHNAQVSIGNPQPIFGFNGIQSNIFGNNDPLGGGGGSNNFQGLFGNLDLNSQN